MRWLELGEQVSMLKSMTQDINREVKDQNSLLDSMVGVLYYLMLL